MTATPRALLPLAALALTACGGTPAPQASDQPPVAVINGRVATWSGAGTVSLLSPGAASALAGADGTFTLGLPGEAAVTGGLKTAADVMAALDCTGSLTSSEVATRGALVGVLSAQDATGARQVLAAEGFKTGPLSRGITARAWLYADGPTQLRGTVDCARLLGSSQIGQLPVTVAVNAVRGWNVVDLNVSASANVFGQVSASGTAANSAGGTALTTWRTRQELQAQIGF